MKNSIKLRKFKKSLLPESTCRIFSDGLSSALMMKNLIVGMVFLGSFTAQAQPGVAGVEALVRLAATKGGTSAAEVTRSLMTQVERQATTTAASTTGALAQAVKNDPLYIFTKGNLDEKSLRYLGPEAQKALIQIGRNTTFKGISSTTEFANQLQFVSSLSRASETTPLSANNQIKVAVNPNADASIAREVESLGLSKNVADELKNELITFRNETGISYTNRGMCQGLNDEAASNFSKLLRDTRENLKRTRQNCPAQFYGSIAESWIHFENGLGREGSKLWSAVEKAQICYTRARLRPGVISAIQAISAKTGGVVPKTPPTGCPL